MLAHADQYSKAFSLKATGGRYPKVSYADYVAGKVPDNEMWKYSSFWYKDFDGMAYKTMLRQLISKWGIMSIEMQTAIDNDMAVINEDGTHTYVDNVPEDKQEYEEINVEPKVEPEEKNIDKKEETKSTESQVQQEFFS